MLHEHIKFDRVWRGLLGVRGYFQLLQAIGTRSKFSHCHVLGLLRGPIFPESLLLGLINLLMVVIQSVAQVRTIAEIVQTTFPRREPIIAPVKVFKEPDNNREPPLIDLFLCPGELLAHSALPAKYFQWLSDIGQCGSLCFWVFKDAMKFHIEETSNQIGKQDPIGYIFLHLD